jgi:hypothetical protein
MLQVYQALSFREKVMLRYYLLSCLLFVPGFAAVAQDESPLSMNQNMIATASPLTGLKLASAADVMTSVTTTDSTMATLVPASKTRWFTANKLHKYLGIGSIAAAGLTVLASGEAEGGEGGGKVDGGVHEDLANLAAGLGGAAILTGLLFHWDDITLANGFSDPDNLHMILTTLGTLGYAKAIDAAPGEGHSGYGMFGAASMLLGIKMVW